MTNNMHLKSIGTIHENQGVFELHVKPEFKAGLKELEHFNYVHILWWADGEDNVASRQELTTNLPYADNMQAGVFACRSPYRPNPIGLSVCPVIDVDHENGIIRLAYIDANDGSPVLDIKPYIPVSDRVRDVTVAPWFKTWPDFYEDAGAFFSKPENQFFD